MVIVYIYCLINLPFSIWQMINVIKQIKLEIKNDKVLKNKVYNWKDDDF